MTHKKRKKVVFMGGGRVQKVMKKLLTSYMDDPLNLSVRSLSNIAPKISRYITT